MVPQTGLPRWPVLVVMLRVLLAMFLLILLSFSISPPKGLVAWLQFRLLQVSWLLLSPLVLLLVLLLVLSVRLVLLLRLVVR